MKPGEQSVERYQHLAICVHNYFSTCFLSQDRHCSVRLGEFSALLPVLQHTFLNFSRHVNQDLVFHGYEVRLLQLLYSKLYSQCLFPLLISAWHSCVVSRRQGLWRLLSRRSGSTIA